jgi:hypothetical protein
MFKVIAQVSNVRPTKNEEPELATTPTNGNMRLNGPGAKKVGVAEGDYVAIVEAADEDGTGLYITKGNKGSAKGETPVVRQSGSVLSGKSGSTLLFSSENAFRTLGGNGEKKQIYSIGDARVEGDQSYFKLTFSRDEEKVTRDKKATAEA